jgi:O-antigen ligase
MQTAPLKITVSNYERSSGFPSAGRKPAFLWILGLAVLGFLACVGVAELIEQYGKIGAFGAFLLIVAGPAAVLGGFMALPQAYRKLVALRHQFQWWHWLILLLYVSTLVFRKRDQDASQNQPLDAWALLRLLPEMIVAGVLLARLLRRQTTWLKSLFEGLPGALAIYALLCAVSTIWSVYPLWTLYKSLELLLDVAVFAAALSSIRSLKQYHTLFAWIWTIYAVEISWVWLQVPLWPSEALEDWRLKGVYPATAWNSVGQTGAILAVLALCKLFPVGRKHDRSFASVLFVFGITTLLISQTRNALGGFVVASALVLILSRRTWLAATMGAMGAIIWIFSRFGGVLLTFLERDQSTESMQNLTGRTDFWSYAWQQFLLHPITGLGAYAAGRFAIMTKLHIDTGTLHSDWIEMLVGIGIMGLVPFAIALFRTWWYVLRSVRDTTLSLADRQMSLEAVGVLSVIFIHSFFNDELTWHAPLLFLAILGYAEMLRRRQKAMNPRVVPFRMARPMSPSPV